MNYTLFSNQVSVTESVGDGIQLLDDIKSLRDMPDTVRIYGYIAILVHQGHGNVSVNGKHVDLQPYDFFLGTPNIVFADSFLSADFSMSGTFIDLESAHLIERELLMSLSLRAKLNESEVFHLNQEDYTAMRDFFTLMVSKLSDATLPDRDVVLRYLVNAGFYEFTGRLKRYYANLPADRESQGTSASVIFSRFASMLDGESLKNHPVQWWAERLNITPKYLSFVCRKVVGKTAGHLIADAIIRDANALLQNPSLNIKQIADQLGFCNQSHFGTFYKRHTGKAPSVRL